MDLGKLIADNFTAILVGVFTVVAGVIGGALGYFGQSVLQARQRRWELDDKRREWRRRRMEDCAEFVESTAKILSELSGGTKPYHKVHEELSPLIIPSFKLAYNSVVGEYMQEYIGKLTYLDGALHRRDQVDVEKFLSELIPVLAHAQILINKSLYDTYLPPPSMSQRFTAWLRSLRQKPAEPASLSTSPPPTAGPGEKP